MLACGTVTLVAFADTGPSATGLGALRLALTLLMLAAWATSGSGSPAERRWTLGAGVVARILVALAPIATGHDVQRYLWDGSVFRAGLDPYRVAPSSPVAAELLAHWPTPPEHAAYVTLYPPGAIFLFGLAARFGPAWAPVIWKALATMASLSMLYVGARLLDRAGKARHLPLLALSPLIVLDTMSGGHLDLFCALAVAVGIDFALRERAGAAGAALGAGALLKFLPALALLPLAVNVGGSAARRLLVCAAGVVGAGYALAFSMGLRPLGSLAVFFEKWRFGSPLFAVLAALFADERARRVGAGMCAVALVVVALAARWRRWTSVLPFALAAPLVASPVVFPWYLIPLVPAVAVAPTGWLVSWLCAIPFANEAIDRFEAGAPWSPAAWPLWVVGLAWAAGAALDMATRRSPLPLTRSGR